MSFRPKESPGNWNEEPRNLKLQITTQHHAARQLSNHHTTFISFRPL